MEYANPNVLVDTQWVEDNLDDNNVRIAEVDYDPKANYNLGHIPKSILIDWKRDINDPLTRNILSKDDCSTLLHKAGINDDATFKSADELTKLYQTVGITPEKEIITYCRIGERSSHTWFVLKHLLGYPDVKNYDGSWK